MSDGLARLRHPAGWWRLLLAVLLAMGNEVLLWTDLLRLDPLEIAVRAVVYLLLATILLDLLVRYRSQDVYDAMFVVAIYALGVGLLISPSLSYDDFPRSLLTRVLGGHALLGIEMLGLWIVFTRGDQRRYRWLMLPVAAWLGFYWGTWMAYTPQYGTLFDEISLTTMFLALVPFVIVALGLYVVALRTNEQTYPEDMLLSNVEWGAVAVVVILIYLWRAVQGEIGGGPLVATILLVGVCLIVMWSRYEPKNPHILEDHLPATPIAPFWMVASAGLFVGATLFAFHLPLAGIPEYNQLWLMEIGFALVGTLWLPLPAVVLAVRGVDRVLRTNALS